MHENDFLMHLVLAADRAGTCLTRERGTMCHYVFTDVTTSEGVLSPAATRLCLVADDKKLGTFRAIRASIVQCLDAVCNHTVESSQDQNTIISSPV